MPGSVRNFLGERSLKSTDHRPSDGTPAPGGRAAHPAPGQPSDPAPRRTTLAGRISFAAATRLRLRRLPDLPGQGFLSISFDDIPRSAWTAGGEVLRRHGVRATYFLNGALCGTIFENREQYRPEDVADIAAEGHEIGSHLFHHVSTLGLTPGQVRREIALNDAFLQQAVGPGFRARSFAYPYGEISLGAKWLCSRRFATSRSVRPGLNRSGADRDQLRIIAIDNIFARGADWGATLAAVARQGAWAIALAHGVDDSDHPYSCPAERLDGFIRQARAAGLEILPIATVADRLGA